MMKLLTISGSLREYSSANAIIRSLTALAPGGVQFIEAVAVGRLPPFDDREATTPDLQTFLAQVRDADAVIICSPEYAFGIPGMLKNALDWTVADGCFNEKIVALIVAATGGEKAFQAFGWVLTALGTRQSPETSYRIPFVKSKLDQNGNITDKILHDELTVMLQHVLLKIQAQVAI